MIEGIDLFFERFESLAKKNRTSPNAIAKELGFSSGSVTAWKKGTTPSALVIEKLADYFNVSTDYLFGRTDSPDGIILLAHSLSDTSLSNLSDDELAALEAYLKVYREGKKD